MVINYSVAVASRMMILFVLLQAVLMHVMLMYSVSGCIDGEGSAWCLVRLISVLL